MRNKGFTIVELLIVIVVIAILAAISIVAYNGIQQRARDTQRKSDISQIAKALKLYAVDYGTYAGANSGCGGSGNGNGWFDNDYDGVGTEWKSMEQCLIDGGYLTIPLRDPLHPQGCSGTFPLSCYRYMKYTCTGGTFLYANLETLPTATNEADGSCYSSADTERGMNYVVKVD